MESDNDTMTPQQNTLVQSALDTARADEQVLGVLLQGSLARGDAHPGSDLDLFVLLHDGQSRPFASGMQDGILVEQHYGDFDRTNHRLRANPMLVYGFLEGRILHDPSGRMAEMVTAAQQVLDGYQTPPEVLTGTLYWLQSARIKIVAAQTGGDWLKAAFVVSTTSWKILEGLWAVNNCPMPPSGSVLGRLGNLTRRPENLDMFIEMLFLRDYTARITAALAVIDWLLLTVPT